MALQLEDVLLDGKNMRNPVPPRAAAISGYTVV